MDKAVEVFRSLSSDGEVTFGRFSSYLSKNDLGLDSESINELFEKADHNKDGIVSATEWRTLASDYPTLIDCIYHKERDKLSEEAFKRSKEQACAEYDNATALEQALRKSCIETAREVEAARESLSQQQLVVSSSEELDDECRVAVTHARSALDIGKEGLKCAMQNLGRAKNSTESTQITIQQQEQQLLSTKGQLSLKLSELQSAESRLKAIEKLLADQKLIVETATRESEDMQNSIREYEAEISRLQKDASDQQSTEEDLKMEVLAMEGKSAEQSQLLRMAEKNLHDSEQTTACEARKTTEEAHRLKTLMAIDADRNNQLQAAIKTVQLAQQKSAQIDEEREAYTQRRFDEHQEELQLLGQEITLRRQRDSLLQKEAVLRKNFSSFDRVGPVTPRLM